MQVVVNLKEIEKKAKKELSKETFSKLCDISLLLHQSIKMQKNVLFTDTQRKRKYVCSALGKKFHCYSSCPSTDHFFDEPTIKKMCQDLKHSVKKRQQYSKKHIQPKQVLQGPSLQRQNIRQPT